MSEQGELFPVEPSVGVARRCHALEERERRKVMAILARMALESLQTFGWPEETRKSQSKEGADES